MNPSGVMASLLPLRVLKIAHVISVYCCRRRQPCQFMRRRNNRPDQHRATLPDLEVRKILSGGCANSRLLRVAKPAECHCHRCPAHDQPNLRLHLRNQFRQEACARLGSIRPDDMLIYTCASRHTVGSTRVP